MPDEITPIEDASEYLSVDFEGLKLTDENIGEVEFDSCVFKGCDFSETTFSRCKFLDCEFHNCNLSLVKLDHSRISEVSFVECKLVGVDWTQVAWPSLALAAPLKLSNCILNESSFFGLQLSELSMRGCKAHHADFREANFSQADFTASDFSGSVFGHTNLTEANFGDAMEYDIDIHRNELRGAIFNRLEAVRLLDSLEIVLLE